MAVALPSGWVDTGERLTLVFSASARVQMNSACEVRLGDWRFYSETPLPYRERVWIHNSNGGSPVLFQEHMEMPPPIQLSNTAEYSETFGPYRLGVRLSLTESPAPRPDFPRHYRIEYQWFGDENTGRTSTFGGETQPQMWMGSGGAWNGTGPGSGITPVAVGLPTLFFAGGGGNVTSGVTLLEISSITLNGVLIDTSDLDDGFLQGLGGGNVIAVSPDSSTLTGYAVPVPWEWSYTLGVTKWGVEDINARLLDTYVTRVELDHLLNQKDPYQEYLETPFTDSYVAQNLPWTDRYKHFNGDVQFTIQSEWAGGMDVPLPSSDLYVPAQTPCPRGQEYYTPAEITVATEVDIHRPDGYPPASEWVSSDTGVLTVAESATTTTFTGITAGGSATRTLSHSWRDRVGLGTGGTSHPDFDIEAYQSLRREDGEDVWAWVAYGYLRIEIDAPVDTNLRLVITGVQLEVFDPHTTGSDRIDNYQVTEHPFSRSWDLELSAGANDIYLDLLMSREGGAFYPERIDSIELSGFGEGEYTLSRFSLAARGDCYWKHSWGVQQQRNDYSAIHFSQGGSFPMGATPDKAIKPDETGSYGGALRMYTVLTGSVTGTILDEQYDLEPFLGQLNRLEGVSMVWSGSSSDAALKDDEGNKFPEKAMFLDPQCDARVAPGVSWTPRCRPRAGRVQLVPGYPFEITVNHPLWGALEALAIINGERAPAATVVEAIRTDTENVVASGETDAYGFVVVQPVPANGLLATRLSVTAP